MKKKIFLKIMMNLVLIEVVVEKEKLEVLYLIMKVINLIKKKSQHEQYLFYYLLYFLYL